MRYSIMKDSIFLPCWYTHGHGLLLVGDTVGDTVALRLEPYDVAPIGSVLTEEAPERIEVLYLDKAGVSSH